MFFWYLSFTCFGVEFQGGSVVKANDRAAGIFVLVLLCFVLFPVLTQAAGLQQVPSQESAVQAFALVDGIPEPKLGPSDVLDITVWNGENREQEEVKIAQDGTVFIPFGVNQTLSVTGLTSTDLKKRIKQELLVYFRGLIYVSDRRPTYGLALSLSFR